MRAGVVPFRPSHSFFRLIDWYDLSTLALSLLGLSSPDLALWYHFVSCPCNLAKPSASNRDRVSAKRIE
jgi:hypothetical protein